MTKGVIGIEKLNVSRIQRKELNGGLQAEEGIGIIFLNLTHSQPQLLVDRSHERDHRGHHHLLLLPVHSLF